MLESTAIIIVNQIQLLEINVQAGDESILHSSSTYFCCSTGKWSVHGLCAKKNRLNDDTSKRNVIMDIFGRDAATLSRNVMLTL